MTLKTIASLLMLLTGTAGVATAASLADAPYELFEPLPVSAAKKDAKPFACKEPPVPVVDLAFGSRYKAGDRSRSELDEEASKATTQALRPVDEFVDEVSQMMNFAYEPTTQQAERSAAANCAMTWIGAWATGDALTRLDSDTAKMSVASRLSGIALSYSQGQVVVGKPAHGDEIELWMQRVMDDVVSFFEDEAGKMTRANNHRAWAALAATSVGMATDTPSTFDWGIESFDAVVCEADEDGALLQEMKRGKRALHYQIYAVSPLVATAAIAEAAGVEGYERCDGSLGRIVNFTVAALDDPSLVKAKSGEDPFPLTSKQGEVDPYELAWADIWLQAHENPALETRVKTLRPLNFSKIGGNTTLLFKRSGEGPAKSEIDIRRMKPSAG